MRTNVACPIAKIGQTTLEWTDQYESSGPNTWSSRLASSIKYQNETPRLRRHPHDTDNNQETA
jgi:hypothetical protein